MRFGISLLCWSWLAAVFCSVSLGAQESRQWTSADRKYTVNAQLVDFDETGVRLRRDDGQIIRVPIEKLSLEDHQYLTQFRAKSPAEDSRLRVPGVFSIGTPVGGFQWNEAQASEMQGTKVQVFTCLREGSTSGITLTVEHRPSRDDGVRVATLKARYNVLLDTLRGAGFTDLKGNRPSIESPVPDKVAFFVVGRGPNGSDRAIANTIIFKDRIYALQAAAGTLDEAQKLSEIATTIREESGQASRPDQDALKKRIEEMTAVVKSGDARSIFRELLPPNEYAALMQSPNADTALADFKATKAPRLLAMLESLDVSKATWNGNQASFDSPGRPVVFTKIDGKWYLKD